jgi:hypothetical protein
VIHGKRFALRMISNLIQSHCVIAGISLGIVSYQENEIILARASDECDSGTRIPVVPYAYLLKCHDFLSLDLSQISEKHY